jgi:tol-pal system protein YbgF
VSRRASLLLALAVPALAGTACVSSTDIEGLHRQLNDVEKEIQSLERKSSSKEEVAKLNDSVSQQTKQLLKSNADLGVRLSELTTKMEQLEARLEDTNRRLSQLSQQIAETQGDLARLRGSAGVVTAPPVSPPAGQPAPGSQASLPDASVRPPAGSARPSPSELYDTAYGDYTKGRYALAIQGFQEYIDAYPGTALSDNAQYWIGESHYAQRKFKESIDDFDRLLKVWPKSGKAAASLLKKGFALLEMGQKAEAVVQLQYVINEHPTSEEARLARAKLKTLGIEAR